MNRRLPVFVDASFQLRLRIGNLTGMRWCAVVVIRVCLEALEMLGVCRLASLCQKSEVLEDVVLGVSPYP